MRILLSINFELSNVTIFEFLELYLLCFWEIKYDFQNKLLENCEMIIDFLYLNQYYLFKEELNLLVCSIIYSASLLITKNQKSSICLLTWLCQISKISEVKIQKLAKILLYYLIGEKIVEIN
eukprot:gene861-9110_t